MPKPSTSTGLRPVERLACYAVFLTIAVFCYFLPSECSYAASRGDNLIDVPPAERTVVPDSVEYYQGISDSELAALIPNLVEDVSVPGVSGKHLTKWNKDISVAAISGDDSAKEYAHIGTLIVSLITRDVEGLLTDLHHVNFVTLVAQDPYNSLKKISFLEKLFESSDRFDKFVNERGSKNKKCVMQLSINKRNEIKNYVAIISTEQPKFNIAQCLYYSIYEGFGMRTEYDSPILFQNHVDSIYNAENHGNGIRKITEFDRKILGLLYNKEIKPGISMEELERVILHVIKGNSGDTKHN